MHHWNMWWNMWRNMCHLSILRHILIVHLVLGGAFVCNSTWAQDVCSSKQFLRKILSSSSHKTDLVRLQALLQRPVNNAAELQAVVNATEALTKKICQSASDEELFQLVKHSILKRLKSHGYLPGLGPNRFLTNAHHLIYDALKYSDKDHALGTIVNTLETSSNSVKNQILKITKTSALSQKDRTHLKLWKENVLDFAVFNTLHQKILTNHFDKEMILKNIHPLSKKQATSLIHDLSADLWEGTVQQKNAIRLFAEMKVEKWPNELKALQKAHPTAQLNFHERPLKEKPLEILRDYIERISANPLLLAGPERSNFVHTLNRVPASQRVFLEEKLLATQKSLLNEAMDAIIEYGTHLSQAHNDSTYYHQILAYFWWNHRLPPEIRKKAFETGTPLGVRFHNIQTQY